MPTLREIVSGFDVSEITEKHQGSIEITDLQPELGTKGHVFVIRGDKSFDVPNANPKFWLYEHLIQSPRVQEQLQLHPNHKLFDGVGFSSLDALNYHAQQIGRSAVVVMAREMYDTTDLKKYPNIEIIRADGPAEQGYIEKQTEVLSNRDDLIPLHQALYGAQSLAPIGNAIAGQITCDEAFFVCASGSNLYSIGSILRRHGCKINKVEPEDKRTIDPTLDFTDKAAVRQFAKEKLDLDLSDWDGSYDKQFFPLHMKYPNRYLMLNWFKTGDTNIDALIGVSREDAVKTKNLLKNINPEYNWTGTTAMALTPAIETAHEGKDVLVMCYGRGREYSSPLWNGFRNIAASIAFAAYLTGASIGGYDLMVNDTPFFNGFGVVDKEGKTWVSGIKK